MHQVRLSYASVSAIRRHAAAAYPEECCGFLLGRRAAGQAVVDEAAAALNRCPERRANSFVIGPTDYLETERAAEGRGMEVLGFYHSHPDGAPDPSVTDLAYAWPNTLYLVASVHSGQPGTVGAFVLAGNGRAFEPLAITEEPHG